MGGSLAKGGNVSLTKEAPGLTAILLVGLGRDVRTTTGTDDDLDASALLCDESGKVLSDAHFVFRNSLKSLDGSVEHTGDNLTGEGEGDEQRGRLHRDGDGLRRAVPARRRVEVPRGRAGLRLRAERHRRRLRRGSLTPPHRPDTLTSPKPAKAEA